MEEGNGVNKSQDERIVIEYYPELEWPEDEEYNIMDDKENGKVGTELPSEQNQLVEEEIQRGDSEDENLFDSYF